MITRNYLAFVLVFLGAACANLAGIEKATLDTEVAPAMGGGASLGGSANQSGGVAGASTGGTASGGALSAVDEAKRLACESFCADVQTTCTGGNQVYTSEEVCRRVCVNFDLGKPLDQTGNTITCRINNVKQAKQNGEVQTHCPAAGPGGNGICGADCESYCGLMDAICPDIFASRVGCGTECLKLPTQNTYNTAIMSGKDVQCRLYHVSAATTNTMLHCPHAGGAVPCQ